MNPHVALISDPASNPREPTSSQPPAVQTQSQHVCPLPTHHPLEQPSRCNLKTIAFLSIPHLSTNRTRTSLVNKILLRCNTSEASGRKSWFPASPESKPDIQTPMQLVFLDNYMRSITLKGHHRLRISSKRPHDQNLRPLALLRLTSSRTPYKLLSTQDCSWTACDCVTPHRARYPAFSWGLGGHVDSITGTISVSCRTDAPIQPRGAGDSHRCRSCRSY